jgi:hypothetical protein
VQGDWQAWNNRSLAEEPIIRLSLGGTVVRVRLDRKATSISLAGPGHPSRRRKGALDSRSAALQPQRLWRDARTAILYAFDASKKVDGAYQSGPCRVGRVDRCRNSRNQLLELPFAVKAKLCDVAGDFGSTDEPALSVLYRGRG